MTRMTRMTRRLSERIQRRLPRGLAASALLAGAPEVWRTFRLAPALALVLALAALFVGSGPGAGSGSHISGATTTTGTTRGAARVVVGGALPGGHPLIGGADFHIENMPEAMADGDDELEMNLTISQTQSDCQTPLYGEFCLRYNILADDAAVQSGYGLIPLSDVTVTGSSVTLRVDISREPRIVRTAGGGGLIALTWLLPGGLPRPSRGASAVAVATVRGRLIEYAVPATGVTAAVLVYGGA